MRKLILYAEDDRDTAELYSDIFRNEGFDVVWAKNGKEAVTLYKEKTPDILVLDLEMPELNGIQVVEEIRRKDQRTPIIILTSYTESSRAVKGFNKGVNDYVRKNIDMDELLVRIQNLIQRNPVGGSVVIDITSDTTIDAIGPKLNSCGKSYDISSREYNLLRILALNKNNPQSRELLTSQVWGNNVNGQNYIGKAISRLRKMMSDDKKIEIVVSRGDSVTLCTNL